MRAALFWARYLKHRGVVRMFGHPGTESIELLEAGREAGIEFVLTQHEATATFAAAMTGKLTGIPGVSVVTAGPGATNVASGVAQAFLDRMPLLVFVGDHAMGTGQPRHQRMPPDLYAGVAKATVRVSAAHLAEELPRAFDLAMAEPQGPVYITFPSAEMMSDIGDPSFGAPRARPKPALPDLAAAERMIAAAERPLVIAGLGVPNAGADAALVRFVDALKAPVADTPQVKGAIPTDHPLYIGTFATHRDAAVAELANASDLVITVGLDSVEFLKPWQLKPPVLALATAGAGDDPAIPATLAVNAPLASLIDALARIRPRGSWPQAAVAEARARFVGSFMPPTDDPGNGRLWPQTVVRVLQEALPDDAIVTVDVGAHKLLMVLQWVARRPGSFLNSSGQSSMGTGVPFAIAAKLSNPSRPVVAVIGDGGMLMYGGELATVARLGLPLTIVVMSDAALQSIRVKQTRRAYAAVGTELGDRVAPCEIARAFGLRSERVTTADACAKALATALRESGPTLIEAVIDPSGYDYSQ
jgi:acetolactate synthase-1/2/3 large subunit